MIKTRVILSAVFLLLPTLGKEELNEIHMWEPASLRSIYSNSKLSYTIANFGTVPYGHSIYGTVFKASPIDGCSPIDKINWDKTQGTLILFVERGNCHFAEKVLNAQRVGAGLVVMGDNAEEDVKKVLPIEKTEEMLRKITVPSILVSKRDSDNFLSVLNDFNSSDRVITLAINFALNKRSDKAHMKMILQVDDFRSYDTVLSFHPYHLKFFDNIDLKLHYKIFKNLPFLFEKENCLERGNDVYCTIRSAPSERVSGLFNETVRQICALESNYAFYIAYIGEVRRKCFNAKGQVLAESGFANCTGQAFARLVPAELKEALAKCADPGGEAIVRLLESNHEKIKYNLINYSPLIFINGYFYKGSYLDSKHLTESFCNSFEVPPSGCDSLQSFQAFSDFSSVGLLRFILVAVALCCIFVVLTVTVFYFFYKKRVTADFRLQLDKRMNEAIGKYYSSNNVNEYAGVKMEH